MDQHEVSVQKEWTYDCILKIYTYFVERYQSKVT